MARSKHLFLKAFKETSNDLINGSDLNCSHSYNYKIDGGIRFNLYVSYNRNRIEISSFWTGGIIWMSTPVYITKKYNKELYYIMRYLYKNYNGTIL